MNNGPVLFWIRLKKFLEMERVLGGIDGRIVAEESESCKPLNQPTFEEIISRLTLILKGELSREEVSDWASEYVMQDDPKVSDENVWDLLLIVSGVDIKDRPDKYLHGEEDIKRWIEKYLSKRGDE